MAVLICHVVFHRDEMMLRMALYANVPQRVPLAMYIKAEIQSKEKGVEVKVCHMLPSCPSCHACADAGL